MSKQILRATRVALVVAAITLGGVACAPAGGGPAPDSAGDETTQNGAAEDAPKAEGTSRDSILMLVEVPFSGFNGDASWDGTTLVLKLEGDATDELETQFVCGVLNEFLEAGETARAEFPNGTVDCAE